MKLEQIFEATQKLKKAVVESEDFTSITPADYKEWCSQIGMKGQKVAADEFKDAAWEVIDNDPKLESSSEEEKSAIISKLWKMHNTMTKGITERTQSVPVTVDYEWEDPDFDSADAKSDNDGLYDVLVSCTVHHNGDDTEVDIHSAKYKDTKKPFDIKKFSQKDITHIINQAGESNAM
jgi:hypothetical protein